MTYKSILMLITILGITLQSAITSEAVFAEEGSGDYRQYGRRPHPPQEAFDACIDAEQGGSCSFEAPHGTLSGTCLTKREDFVCVPDNPPPLHGQGGEVPPGQLQGSNQ